MLKNADDVGDQMNVQRGTTLRLDATTKSVTTAKDTIR